MHTLLRLKPSSGKCRPDEQLQKGSCRRNKYFYCTKYGYFFFTFIANINLSTAMSVFMGVCVYIYRLLDIDIIHWSASTKAQGSTLESFTLVCNIFRQGLQHYPGCWYSCLTERVYLRLYIVQDLSLLDWLFLCFLCKQ